jgi:hypothetical protein
MQLHALVCQGSMESKQYQEHAPKFMVNKATKILELVHLDLCNSHFASHDGV